MRSAPIPLTVIREAVSAPIPGAEGVTGPTPTTAATLTTDPGATPGGGCATRSSCGSGAVVTDAEIAEKVANHPCYSQEAHQYYARMHVAVAPGCNIQCNYCNRKFDCANESRPGVTSRKLTPDEALAKVKLVASEIKQMSVLGIAGPGDPLANPRNTFRTLELVARDCPDIKLCLSTNGLKLLDHVDQIEALGIDHVTLTINMIDPEVGERIYPWVVFQGRRYRGRDAAKVLSDRQLAGLQALTERKILCKVNSVMIPGVNDDHLVEVSRTVKSMGAFLHNVMPLVSAPEHGTHYGLTGQRGPTPQELKALQDRCEGDDGAEMNMMRHCRQCRADAVGLLGEDRSEEFGPETYMDNADGTPGGGALYDLAGRRETHADIERWREEVRSTRVSQQIEATGQRPPDQVVLVAVATKGGGVVNQHFGHADEFWIYEAGPGWAKMVQTRSVSRYCSGPSECDDDESTLDKTVRLLGDCRAVLCSKVGPEPLGALVAAGIEPVEVYDLIDQAVEAVGRRLVGSAATSAPGAQSMAAPSGAGGPR